MPRKYFLFNPLSRITRKRVYALKAQETPKGGRLCLGKCALKPDSSSPIFFPAAPFIHRLLHPLGLPELQQPLELPPSLFYHLYRPSLPCFPFFAEPNILCSFLQEPAAMEGLQPWSGCCLPCHC